MNLRKFARLVSYPIVIKRMREMWFYFDNFEFLIVLKKSNNKDKLKN